MNLSEIRAVHTLQKCKTPLQLHAARGIRRNACSRLDSMPLHGSTCSVLRLTLT